MPDAFTERADFSNLLQRGSRDGITINKVVSKTLIELNEEGTIAAAASASK